VVTNTNNLPKISTHTKHIFIPVPVCKPSGLRNTLKAREVYFKEKKMRKTISLFSILISLSLLLAACGGSTAAPAAAATQSAPAAAATQAPAAAPQLLRVWVQWGDNPKQMQTLFDKYTAQTGIKVEVSAPLADDKILPALTGSNPPDVLVLSGGDLTKSYFKDGLLDELTGAIKTGSIDLTDFYPAPLSQCQDGAKIVCLPWGTDAYALLWNKDMFEAAGLDPNKPPATLEELVQYADKLTKVGADGKIEQIGFIPNQAWGHADLYARVFGGFWYSDDGKSLTANSQAMIDALTWEQGFFKKYGVDKIQAFASGFGEYNSANAPFYDGKLAMIVDGEWQTGPNFIPGLKPELNYGVAAFPPPAAHPERAGTIVNQGTVAVIPSGAPNKDASAKLLAWMMSPAIVAEEFCFNANLPTSKKAAQDPCFQKMGPKFQVFLDLMSSKNAVAVINTPISLEFNTAMGSSEENILLKGADPKTELDALQAQFDQKLKDSLK
jgi:multiple sugar transport system substrate-binding protein